MTTTVNDYINDKGELKITITAAGETATGLTAGAYSVETVLRSFKPVTEPERKSGQTNVTGGTINTAGDLKGIWEYELVFVDDYMKGALGELGPVSSEFTVVELLEAHRDAGVALGDVLVTPAGASTGMIQATVTGAEVLYVSGIEIDADNEKSTERKAKLSFQKDAISFAAHA